MYMGHQQSHYSNRKIVNSCINRDSVIECVLEGAWCECKEVRVLSETMGTVCVCHESLSEPPGTADISFAVYMDHCLTAQSILNLCISCHLSE